VIEGECLRYGANASVAAAKRGRADSLERCAHGAVWREAAAREFVCFGSNLGRSSPPEQSAGGAGLPKAASAPSRAERSQTDACRPEPVFVVVSTDQLALAMRNPETSRSLAALRWMLAGRAIAIEIGWDDRLDRVRNDSESFQRCPGGYRFIRDDVVAAQ